MVAAEARHLHKRVYVEADGSAPPPPPPPPRDFAKFLSHFLRIDAPFVSVRTSGVGNRKSVSVDAPFVSVRTAGALPPPPGPSGHPPPPPPSAHGVSVDTPFVSVRTGASNTKRKSVSVDAPFVSVRTSGDVAEKVPAAKPEKPKVSTEKIAEKETVTNEIQPEKKNVSVEAPFVSVNSQKNHQVHVRAPFTTVSNGNVNVDLSPIFGPGFNIVDVVAPFTNVKVG